MEKRNGFSDAMSTIGAMLLGAFIGAGIALLMAPKPGSQLRSELREGATRVGERLSEAGQDVAESVKSRINQLGSKAESLGDRAEDVADDLSSQ